MLITASIVSERLVSTDAGSTASASPAASPAHGPNPRRTRSNSSSTEITPASAGGSRSASDENPSSFVVPTCSHRSSGALSIDTRPDGSSAPKTKLCHDRPIERTAAS